METRCQGDELGNVGEIARHEQLDAAPPVGGPTAVEQVLTLQRTVGNAAVARAIRGVSAVRTSPAPRQAPGMASLMRVPTATAARQTVARTKLGDYNDSDPKHDPSHVAESEIVATDEFKKLATKTYPPRKGPVPHAQAVLACRLMLRYMRQAGKTVKAPMKDAPKYLTLAEEQAGTLGAAEGQVGQLNWAPFDTGAAVSDPTKLPTEFGRWALAGGPMPDKISGTINCWEMVLFGAFKAGYLDLPRIKAIYKLAVDNVKAKRTSLVGDTVETELQASSPQVFDPGDPDSPAPLPGDLVVFNSATMHMAIATGTVTQGKHGVISLWTQPGNDSHTQRTTIEDLLVATGSSGKPVKFWTAKW